MRRAALVAVLSLLAAGLALPSGASAAKLVAKDSRYGKVLFDGSDRVLYLFTKEETEKARCYGECAEAWPPYIVDGRPKSGRGAKERHIGLTERRDGSLQGTYRGHPLYYYVHDDPGEILCNDVFEFGGDWFVVTPDGKAAG